MVTWPAVIKYHGDDELTYIGSDEEWLRDADSHLYHHSGDDLLIDSSGGVYRLALVDDQVAITDDPERHLTLDDFVRLVRIHASSTHRCCIEKISFRTFAEGIGLVASMSEH